MSTPTQETSTKAEKHQWSLEELKALHLLYEYYGLPTLGKYDESTDDATRIILKMYGISSSKAGSSTELFRTTYRERYQQKKTMRWKTVVKASYTNNELDDFRRIKDQIETAAKSLGIQLSGDDTRSPFGYADVEAAKAVEVAEDAWTEAEKLGILFQIIAANNEKIPWDKIDMPKGRTLKAVQVMFDEEKAKVRKSTKAKASVDGNEEVVDETSAIAAEEVEAAADRPVNKIAAVPTPSSREDETEKVENGGQDEASGSENETEA